METSDFLESADEKIKFESASHLRHYLNPKKFKESSRRKAGLKEDHGERHALRIFLLTTANQCTFPLVCKKSERPDFILSMPDMDIGLEISQTTTTEIERDYSQISRRKEGEFIEYTPDGHHVLQRGEPLRGPGFFGHQDCQRVAQVAANSLASKAEALNKPGFYLACSNQLLLLNTYDLTLDMNDPTEVEALEGYLIDEFRRVREKSKHAVHYDSVHFIEGSYLFMDVMNNAGPPIKCW